MRKLPGVDTLLENQRVKELTQRWSQPLVVKFIREAISSERKSIKAGRPYPGDEKLIDAIANATEEFTAGLLTEVINASGIIIHTNLGRAPLPRDILSEVFDIATAYSNLEFDLLKGKRGKRGSALRHLISAALGCESALVVNNNASAVYLILVALSKGKEALISRGEQVQIGGGFKIPDIMEESGAIMKEVGTTNRTALGDYRKAITKNTALILKVHRSNFIIEGFTEETGFSELAELGKKKKVPVVLDIGSGVLLHPSESGLSNEPTVIEALKSKADLVCFSGDKLLGGVQAGIILGKKRLIDKLNKNPIYRVVRPDKLVIGALEKLFIKYLKDEIDGIPIWKQIKTTTDELYRRSEKFVAKLGLSAEDFKIRDGIGYAGGGSDPGGKMPSVIIAFQNVDTKSFADKMRKCNPPVIGRTEGGKYCIDLRTVLPHQEETLIRLLKENFSN